MIDINIKYEILMGLPAGLKLRRYHSTQAATIIDNIANANPRPSTQIY